MKIVRIQRNAQPDAAECKRIKARVEAGVPINWIAKLHGIGRDKIRQIARTGRYAEKVD